MQGTGYTDDGVHMRAVLPFRLRVCLKHLSSHNSSMNAHNLRFERNLKFYSTQTHQMTHVRDVHCLLQHPLFFSLGTEC